LSALPKYGSIQECVEDFIKYRDTTRVLSALREYLNQRIFGRLIGVEHTFKLEDGTGITPDLTLAYENDSACCFIELKWRISQSSIKNELLDLKRYFNARQSLNGSSQKVTHNDIIMICHINDSNVVIDAVNELAGTPDVGFLKQEGVAIWSWYLGIPKGADTDANPEMRFGWLYGKTRNLELEKKIRMPGGIVIPASIAFSPTDRYLFTKDKPPVHYAMAFLLQHILSSFQDSTHRSQVIPLSLGMVDELYEKSKIFFPGWRDAESETIQARKEWIREAVDLIIQLKIKVSVPLPRTRKTIQQVLCARLERLRQKSRGAGPRVRKLRVRPDTMSAKLSTWFNSKT